MYSFQSLCETYWYSICKVCMLIAYYQAFLEYAVSVQGTLDKYPRIPGPVIQFLTVEHFMMNGYMFELVTMVADLRLLLLSSSLLYRSSLVTWKQSATSATSSLMLLLVLYPTGTNSTSLTSCLCHCNVSFSKIS